ncbi:hypothetical protein ABB37_00535 [Leptomonas pyrrhocoris]|uniref:AttH domain-containing protein n=1 Tax=Leptomonas pyrrhocoris TaxID=157538 RepID=A0A0N0E0D5_LEPPY|nr:hypothetical protein ABB37_00535 [Leptomonas pyrrhocoris]KPA86322.1 hypothetical protein ABB37_00535 [Leptomonas pyrrhocoris]|eukprot:XP_015664761.1 hypothetical protein ABB37_00535 [Leptomonas pyrrhocoris]
MHFAAVDPVNEPPAQRQRLEDESAEEKSVKARLHNSWPQISISPETHEVTMSEKDLRSTLFEHDRAHEHCLNECWILRSRFGVHNRFGLSVTFRSVAVVSDVDPPNEDAYLTHACVVSWSITDHEKRKFYRFNACDERSPELLSMLIAKKTLRDQPAMLQAVVEQLNNNRLVLPDQMLSEAASMRLTELDLQFGKNTFKSFTPPLNYLGESRRPTYTLHLEGVSNEREDPNLDEEVKAEVDLSFMPRGVPPALDGVRGVVSNGNWEEDEFCYCLHHVKSVTGSLRITRASDNLEVARDPDIRRGTVWMEHSFGGVVPRTVEEARFVRSLCRRRIAAEQAPVIHDRCLIRLYDEQSNCFTVTRVVTGGTNEVLSCCATVQSGMSRQAYQYNSDASLTDEVDGCHQSKDTGIVYPTRWKVRCPMPNGARVELQLTATLPNQELITALAQPSIWDGTVLVKGKMTQADGRETTVSGDGYLTSRGRGKLQTEKTLFSMLHGIATFAVTPEDVAKMPSWESIADGPAIAAVAKLSVALKTQSFELTSPQQIVMAAFIGTYGYIFHHANEVAQVKKALQWCYSKWMTFFGVSSIRYRTLALRAFMMQELCDLMHAKCASWIPAGVEALDIAVPVNYIANDVADSAAFTLPARTLLLQPPSALEIAQIKALMDGTWVMDPSETKGSMNALLMEQGVGVLWRSVNNNVVPTWKISVNSAVDKLVIDESSMLERRKFVLALNGSEWAWESVSRGPVKSRSCVLSNGRELYVETDVRGGIERVWYQFQNGGRTMVQHMFFYPTATTPKATASCERHFKIQLPPGSPTSPR